jgi:glutathione S-transferase
VDVDELWQTEWCPASRRVRQRLTELGIDYVIRQVPVERADRVLLRARTGVDAIPVLVTDAGEVVAGEAAIAAHLDARAPATATETTPTTPQSRAHRLKAEKARRRYLEEECECSQRATP